MLISHSSKIVEGARDLAMQMAEGAKIVPVGGTNRGELGTDFDRIFEEMDKATSEGDLVLLYDAGSALLTAETARDALDPEKQKHVYISTAALVEGALAAAVAIAADMPVKDVLEQLEDVKLDK
jgi:dihydroxyacetone kinase phosphotransfer subunit